MNEKLEQLMKARAKTLAHHFNKAAAHHDAKADAHEKMAAAHQAHHEHHKAMHESAETDHAKEHHKASAAFHKSKAAHHTKMHKLHKGYAEHHRSMAAAHNDADADDAAKVLKLAGLEEEALSTRPVTPAAVTTPATPVVPATPATPVVKAAGEPSAEGTINDTIQKALDTKLSEAVNAAFERVLSSNDFNQKVDQAIAGKLLEKLGSSTVDTPIRTFAVPRGGAPAEFATNKTSPVDTSNLDPELADLCKVEV